MAGTKMCIRDRGITADKIEKIVKLNKIAENRGQSLAQMACAWNLRGGKLTSVLLGASKSSQIIENVNSLNNLDFTQDELNAIEDALKDVYKRQPLTQRVGGIL